MRVKGNIAKGKVAEDNVAKVMLLNSLFNIYIFSGTASYFYSSTGIVIVILTVHLASSVALYFCGALQCQLSAQMLMYNVYKYHVYSCISRRHV